ncbi:hypothetical protein G3N58_15140 [Paraburkholderia sp. Ac-20342]|uniref:portal protein n=1 Tax=Paraburkholderia sp. Ac-20342 TaxID=2703889 RepID=UPI001980C79C|nr:hypothetical protein [Paraburkholderia sp. Ac-20342]MBN3848155.1 hypothetical protein [Paraburkholderia sp. Ac-20342]
MVSPYLDRNGQPTSTLHLRSAYVDRENNRYGHVTDMLSLQDELNKRRSKALHLISVRQTFGNQNAIRDLDQARRELAKPDGHIEIQNAGELNKDFGILPTGDMAAAQIELMQQVTGELQASGPNAAMAGKDPRIQSGRAIQSQQAGGAIEVEPIIDDLRQWTKQVYEASWLCIRQFWTSEKWIRVTDDERNAKWVGLNQPVTLQQALGELDPAEAAQYLQQVQPPMQPNDPRLQQIVRVDNDIAGLDVDITIEEGPDVANIQAEQFQMLTQLAQSGVPLPPAVLIEASQLRNKDKLIEMLEQSQQQNAGAQQQAQQINTAKAQADISKTTAEAEHAHAQAVKAMSEAHQPQEPAAAAVPAQGPSTLDQMKTAAEIRKLDAQAGAAQSTAIRNIAAAQQAPQVVQIEQ